MITTCVYLALCRLFGPARAQRACLVLVATLLAATSAQPAAAASRKPAGTISVMAPLLMTNDQDWDRFREELRAAKAIGVDAIESDVWWGVAEGQARGQFDWSYYHRLATEVRNAGLKWIPILSTHECGGNVGDSVNIPLPQWIWGVGASRGRTFKFKSEGGNESQEYIQFWDTPFALDLYKEFYSAFRDEFAGQAANIAEIIVSMGPAGEMHYPSYNAQDRALSYAGYPYRGAMQASSDAARASFRDAMKSKYGTLDALAKAWGGRPFSSWDQISPPSGSSEVSQLFASGAQFSAYGQDLFDWYRASMLTHARQLGDAAMDVFEGNPSFAHTPFGYKMAGVHWAMDTRLAELTAGELSTRASEVQGDWNSIDRGLGYRPLVDALAGLQAAHPAQAITLYYTSAMTPNGNNDPDLKPGASRAQDQSQGVSKLLHERGLNAGFENALDSDLMNPQRVGLIGTLVRDQGYTSASFLRLSDVVRSPIMSGAIRAAKPVVASASAEGSTTSRRSSNLAAVRTKTGCERLLTAF